MLKGEGRDTTGKGAASAIITAQLTSVTPTSTKCTVVTNLTISGKVAQFGRGALADVSDKLLAQFSENLNQLITSAPATPSAPAASTAPAAAAPAATEVAAASPEIRKIESAEVAPLDLLGTAGAPILKRAIPVAIALIVVVIAAIKFL
jgi:hypothetical protein